MEYRPLALRQDAPACIPCQPTNVDFSEIDAFLRRNQCAIGVDTVYEGPPIGVIALGGELAPLDLFDSPSTFFLKETVITDLERNYLEPPPPMSHDPEGMLAELKNLSSRITEDLDTLTKAEERIDAANSLMNELGARISSAIKEDAAIIQITNVRVNTSYNRVNALNIAFKDMISKTSANDRCVQCRDSYRSLAVCRPKNDGSKCARCTRKGRECTPLGIPGVRKSRRRRCKQCTSLRYTTDVCLPTANGSPCGNCVAHGVACRP